MAAARANRCTSAPVATAALALLLAGCSGTPFGDRLAGSFSGAPQPSPTAPAKPAAAQAPAPKTPASDKPPAEATAATEAASAPPAARSVPLAPAPYRITIKLPAADPSAPAELVTEALRRAGVPFEVEMIERVSGVPAAPSLPTPTPAPAPRPR